MANAVLTITAAGGADVRRALGRVADEGRRANSAMSADARRAAADRRRIEADEVREGRRAFQQMLRAREAAEREATRAAAREARRRATEERAVLREVARERQRSEAEAVRDAEATSRAIFRARARAERDATRVAAEQTRERMRLNRMLAQDQTGRIRQAPAGRGGGGGGGFGGQLLGAAQGYSGQVQDARQRRAGTERTLGGAIFQAGGNRGDVQAGMRTLGSFAAANGMDSGELAGALSAAQTEFNSLAPGAGETLQGRLRAMLGQALRVRNMGLDVGEGMRLQGLFAQSGLGADAQDYMLRYTAGAANRGAVEAGSVTRESMTAIVRRMNQATSRLGPNATTAERQQAQQAAFVQSFAELQVARSAGLSTRQAGNAYAAVNDALQGRVTQQRMYTNIANDRGLTGAQRTAMLGQLFNRDHTLRAEYADGLRFTEAFASRVGDNPTAFANIFRGGGHGNPQAMQANWRTALSAMLSTNAEGVAGHTRVRQLMGADVALGERDVERGAGVFGQDAQSDLARAQEAHDNALTDNTNGLNRLSTLISDWLARNPLAQAALPLAGGLLTGGGGTAAGGGALGIAARGLGVTAPVAGLGLAGVGLAGAGLYAQMQEVNRQSGTTTGERMAAAWQGGAAEDALAARVERHRQAQAAAANEHTLANHGLGQQSTLAALGVSPTPGGLPEFNLSPRSADQFAAALRTTPLIVRLDPADAAHANAAGANGRPVVNFGF